jgi:hypothetical protein
MAAKAQRGTEASFLFSRESGSVEDLKLVRQT